MEQDKDTWMPNEQKNVQGKQRKSSATNQEREGMGEVKFSTKINYLQNNFLRKKKKKKKKKSFIQKYISV